jgi:peptidoglycan/LPS O-acetylase OafA/YrhL
VFFACGALLAIERVRVALMIAKLRPVHKAVLLVLCVYCFIKRDFYNHSITGAAVDYLRGVGALLLIALALGVQRFAAALSNRCLTWLGRISYSLYLVHFPILYAVYAFDQKVHLDFSPISRSAIIVVVSLGIADLMYRLVEIPSIRLGRRLASPETQKPSTAVI